MAILSEFNGDVAAFYELCESCAGKNRRKSEGLEQTLTFLHGKLDLFFLYGWDGDYASALIYYQEVLDLLDVAQGSSEWDITVTDLASFFAVSSGGSGTGTVEKYTQSITLSAGVETDVTTTLALPPYTINIYDSTGTNITGDLPKIRAALSGGYYHLYIYSVDALTGLTLYITY